jgi:small conductance mechanosensitive channel
MLGGIVLALMIVGVQMGPVVLLLLIVVAVVGISGRQILEDFAAGLSLQITTPFVVGDRIETAGTTGWVEAITGRAVVLTSRDRRTVHIPNSTVLESVLYNYTDDQQRRTEMGFGVSYMDDPVLAGEVSSAAVAGLDLVHPEPAPVAYVDELGSDGVIMKMRFYHEDDNRIAAGDEVAEAIMTSLAEAGIEMPTPEIAIPSDPSRTATPRNSQLAIEPPTTAHMFACELRARAPLCHDSRRDEPATIAAKSLGSSFRQALVAQGIEHRFPEPPGPSAVP